MSYNRKTNVIEYNYNIGGVEIKRCTEFRDLGIIMDSRLSFVPHINNINCKALKMLGFVIRTTKDFKNTDCMFLLYFAYVRSILEYCTLVWDPYYNIHISALENIQRRFCKYVYFRKHGIYPVRNYPQKLLLAEFDLIPLVDRRKYFSLTFLYKLLHGIIQDSNLLSQINFCVPRLNNRQPLVFSNQVSRTNQHLHSPILNMTRLYNVNAAHLDVFVENFRFFCCTCKNLCYNYTPQLA